MRTFTLLTLLVACGGDTLGGRDAGHDAGQDASVDAPASDAGRDVGVDAFVPPDTGPDLGPPDAGVGLVPVPPPAPPTFDDVIDTISVAVTTGTGVSAATDDGVDLCVNATDCFHINVPDVDDRERGNTDALHFEGLAIPRSSVTGITLRTRSPLDTDNDRWTPTCLEVRFDGEPVYCERELPHIGTGSSSGEVASFTDPEGLHQDCVTCWDGALTHGPVQGAHTTDAARVWVRSDATRRVGLRMDREGSLSDASPLVAWVAPRPATDFSETLHVEGLRPGERYDYRVEVLDEDGATLDASAIHSLNTAPPDSSRAPLRLALASCSRQVDQPTAGALHAFEPDLFFFLGDIHYANSRHRDAHRWHYRRFRGVPERAALLAETATIASWDDHDFVGNNSNGICAGRDEAIGAFDEAWPNPPMGIDGTPGTFFRHRVGAVEFVALDCRTYRPDVGDGGRRCDLDESPPTLDPARGPIGAAQWTWAMDALAASDATFKFLSCGSRFTMQGSLDSWRAFPEAQTALMGEIASRGIEGVVLLSGDIHRSEIRRVPRSSAYDLYELTASPLANTNSGCGGADPERLYCLDAGNSFVTVDVDPAADDPTLTARVHDASGGIRFEHTILRSELR